MQFRFWNRFLFFLAMALVPGYLLHQAHARSKVVDAWIFMKTFSKIQQDDAILCHVNFEIILSQPALIAVLRPPGTIGMVRGSSILGLF